MTVILYKAEKKEIEKKNRIYCSKASPHNMEKRIFELTCKVICLERELDELRKERKNETNRSR